jgi:hypothetical protein
MKKKTFYKIAGIGCLHTFLYSYLIPFIIFPAFGENGLKLAVAVAVAISIIILITIFIEKIKQE